MLRSEEANLIKWHGREKPFYEVFYLKLNDPSHNAALWLRYTFLSPVNGAPEASLWAIFFDSSDHTKNRAVKETVSMKEVNFKRGHFKLNIGGAELDNTSASGVLSDGSRISWNLRWLASEVPYRHYPWILYYLPWPTSKVVAPNLNVPVAGWFEVDGKRFELSNAMLHQGHVWGKHYSDRWAWANCGMFVEDRNAVLELLMRPPIGLGYLRAHDLDLRFKIKGEYSPLGWRFEGSRGRYLIRGNISASEENIVGVTYKDPVAGERYCYNTKIANALVEVHTKVGGKWQLSKRLNSYRTTAFETVESHPISGLPLEL